MADTVDIGEDLLKLFAKHEAKWYTKVVKDYSADGASLSHKEAGDAEFKGYMLGWKLAKAIEHRFLVCLPLSPHNRNWTFDQFTKYISNRARKHSVNLRLAQKRAKEALPDFWILVIAIAFVAATSWPLIGHWTLYLFLPIHLIILVIFADSLLTWLAYRRLANALERGGATQND